MQRAGGTVYKKGEFTLDDFRKQLVSGDPKLGPMGKVMGMLGMDGGLWPTWWMVTDVEQGYETACLASSTR